MLGNKLEIKAMVIIKISHWYKVMEDIKNINKKESIVIYFLIVTMVILIK